MTEETKQSMKRDMLSFMTIITSPIGMEHLPDELFKELYEVTRRASIWMKAKNADELED